MAMKPTGHRGVDLPVFEKTLEAYKNLEFLKPEKYVDVLAGWYQNGDGKLYHYDGVVWDEVPGEKIEKLEYLG